jgi:Fe-S-cluster-containing dehydrogenase component
MERRDFLTKGLAGALTVLIGRAGIAHALAGGDAKTGDAYDWEQHHYVYLIDISKCIGCTMCVRACKRENDVPDGYVRTWVERYHVLDMDEVIVDSPRDGGLNGYQALAEGDGVKKAFFVPKMCNHCNKSPCEQVCPVGASYRTKEGVILVDGKRCIGCGYCVQACPYGCRSIHPVLKVANKCTWCYHRITKGMKPACVAACPQGARQFGDMKDPNDPVRKILMEKTIQVLRPELLTEPQCYYLNLDKGVR